MPVEDIKIDYYPGAYGRTLRIDIRTANGMTIFTRALREMATGPEVWIHFSEHEGVSASQRSAKPSAWDQ